MLPKRIAELVDACDNGPRNIAGDETFSHDVDNVIPIRIADPFVEIAVANNGKLTRLRRHKNQGGVPLGMTVHLRFLELCRVATNRPDPLPCMD